MPQMPAPSSGPSKFPSKESPRENLILATASLFAGIGFLMGVFAFLGLFKVVERALGYPQLPFTGLAGCLLTIVLAVGCGLIVGAGLLLGWWLWLRLIAGRLAVTKEESYLLITGPLGAPVMSRLGLRIAGISKAEEKELRDARPRRK